jgi:Cu/Ag efflux protein CusF
MAYDTVISTRIDERQKAVMQTMSRRAVINEVQGSAGNARRFLALCLGVIIVFTFGLTAVAQEEIKLRGTVTRIDEAAKSVTIKAKDGAEVAVIMDDAGMLSRVKEDEKAEVTYRVKNGVNAGIRLRKLVEGCN